MPCFDWRADLRLLAVLAACGHGMATAGPVLVLGPAYPVAEPDLLQQMETRAAAALRARPDWRASQQQAALSALQQPPGPDLPRAAKGNSHAVDASITLAEGGYDSQGRWYPAGSRLNPLAHTGLTRPVLFFDARDARQLAFAASYLAATPAAHAVLTGGDPSALAAVWQRPVYFDQHGWLAQRLGLQQVPALLSQRQGSLHVDELVP